ncbi:MAG: hypothetical protein AAF441_02440 [Pseudomonadota bacterium]
MNLLRTIFAAAVLAGLTAHAQAQNTAQPAEPGGSQIRMFDAWAQFPYPSWHKTENALAESKVSRQQHADTFVVAMVPKKESFRDWTNQYTLFGTWRENLTLRKFMNSSVSALLTACGRDNFKLRKIQRNQNSALVAVYCMNSPNGPAAYGYGDGVGEVTLMWMGQFQNSFVKIYEQWRGPKFNPADTSSWPVSKAVLDRSIVRFSGIRLLPYTQ